MCLLDVTNIYFGSVLLNILLSKTPCTAQKIKFSIKDLFSKCGQIRRFRRIWSHLLKKSLRENLIFCAVISRQVIEHLINYFFPWRDT